MRTTSPITSKFILRIFQKFSFLVFSFRPQSSGKLSERIFKKFFQKLQKSKFCFLCIAIGGANLGVTSSCALTSLLVKLERSELPQTTNIDINTLLQYQMVCTHIHTTIGKLTIMKSNTNGEIWGDICGCFAFLLCFNIAMYKYLNKS